MEHDSSQKPCSSPHRIQVQCNPIFTADSTTAKPKSGAMSPADVPARGSEPQLWSSTPMRKVVAQQASEEEHTLQVNNTTPISGGAVQVEGTQRVSPLPSGCLATNHRPTVYTTEPVFTDDDEAEDTPGGSSEGGDTPTEGEPSSASLPEAQSLRPGELARGWERRGVGRSGLGSPAMSAGSWTDSSEDGYRWDAHPDGARSPETCVADNMRSNGWLRDMHLRIQGELDHTKDHAELQEGPAAFDSALTSTETCFASDSLHGPLPTVACPLERRQSHCSETTAISPSISRSKPDNSQAAESPSINAKAASTVMRSDSSISWSIPTADSQGAAQSRVISLIEDASVKNCTREALMADANVKLLQEKLAVLPKLDLSAKSNLATQLSKNRQESAGQVKGETVSRSSRIPLLLGVVAFSAMCVAYSLPGTFQTGKDILSRASVDMLNPLSRQPVQDAGPMDWYSKGSIGYASGFLSPMQLLTLDVESVQKTARAWFGRTKQMISEGPSLAETREGLASPLVQQNPQADLPDQPVGEPSHQQTSEEAASDASLTDLTSHELEHTDTASGDSAHVDSDEGVAGADEPSSQPQAFASTSKDADLQDKEPMQEMTHTSDHIGDGVAIDNESTSAEATSQETSDSAERSPFPAKLVPESVPGDTAWANEPEREQDEEPDPAQYISNDADEGSEVVLEKSYEFMVPTDSEEPYEFDQSMGTPFSEHLNDEQIVSDTPEETVSKQDSHFPPVESSAFAFKDAPYGDDHDGSLVDEQDLLHEGFNGAQNLLPQHLERTDSGVMSNVLAAIQRFRGQRVFGLEPSLIAPLSPQAIIIGAIVLFNCLVVCVALAVYFLRKTNPTAAKQSVAKTAVSEETAIDDDDQSEDGIEGTMSPKRSTPKAADKAKTSPATWLASKLTPNRISKIETDGDLDFRQLRQRTIVTAKGKQVGDLDPKARIPRARKAKEVTETPEAVTTTRMTRRQPARQAKTASKYY